MASPRPAPPAAIALTRISRRVLGSPATLLPRSNSHTPNSNVTNGRISPSASEVSLTSRSDMSRGSEGLVCPICSEEMMTLLQLNRHLDDTHAEVEPLEKDDITTWFRKRMMKAKTFQPVAVLNQKLKGLDVFETNEPPAAPTVAATTTTREDADFYVTRAHWQKSYGDDFCLDPTCQRPLGVVNGCVNCRKCGKLFCEEHTMYQIKLSRSAQHEPVRGYWSRVCETCYKSREGYNGHYGVTRDHTEMFRERRKAKVERHCLEVRRAEKRLTKLTQLLTAPPEQAPNPQGGFIIGLTKPLLHNQRRVLEQSVVAWEDDATVSNCPNCAQTFSRFSQPKHHCRICGKVVCGDPRTLCSKEISLDVAPPSEKPGAGVGTVALNIRICTPCTTTLFSKRDFALSLLSPPPSYVRAYATLVSFQTGIGEQLPRFQRMVEGIQRDPGDRDRVMEVVKMKRRIVEALAKVDGVAKTIAGARGVCGGRAGGRGAEGKLRHSIAAATANWGREIGLHVKTAATVLDAVVSSTRPSAKEEIAARLGKKLPPPPPPPPAPVPVLPAAIHVEESPEDVSARETVVVLEEQKFLLLQMMEDAKHRRQFDEVEALGRSLEEIEAEVVALGGGVVGV